jgi:hypothetical protein
MILAVLGFGMILCRQPSNGTHLLDSLGRNNSTAATDDDEHSQPHD